MLKRYRCPGLAAAYTLGVAIALALCVSAISRASTARNPMVTNRVMIEGLEAIHYPVANPRRLTCRGLGAAVRGAYRSFHCVASLKRDREHPFYVRAVAEGGWLCAGKSTSDCRVLMQGFFATGAADTQGWQPTAVLGWLKAHHIEAQGGDAVSCTGTKSPITCTLERSLPLTVIISYRKTRGGYVETARRK